MPEIMTQMFVNDFLEAREAEKQLREGILNKQITVQHAVNLFEDKIGYIRKDLATLDDDARNKHKNTYDKMMLKCKENKQKFKSQYDEPDDPITMDNYNENLAYEDFKMLSAELKFIQRLGFEKNWLA